MQQFHTITHSFAQRRADYSSVFSRLRTLLLSIGGGGVSRALLLPPSHLAPLSPVPSLACAYFLSPRGGVPSTRFGFLSPQPQASRASSLQPPGLRTGATSTFSSRTGTSANTPEQRP